MIDLTKTVINISLYQFHTLTYKIRFIHIAFNRYDATFSAFATAVCNNPSIGLAKYLCFSTSACSLSDATT